MSSPSVNRAVLLLSCAFALAACSTLATRSLAETQWECPLPGSGETSEDCPWAGISRKLTATATAGLPLIPVLESEAPEVLRQIRADSARPDLLELWGTSINYDELAKGEILQPELIDTLLIEARAPLREDRLVHAGVEHTYGYLFSTLKTPYGFKRARWVRDDIEAGLELPKGVLGPSPGTGTLLLNLTAAMGAIGLEGDAAALAVLQRHAAEADPAVQALKTVASWRKRLEETVTWEGREYLLRTDFLGFRRPAANAALLIYTVFQDGRGKLITAFPVAQGFVDTALKPANLGQDKPVITRYNAFVPGLTGLSPPATGHRRIVDVAISN